MINPHDLEFVYRQGLEIDIIRYLCKKKKIDELAAMRLYYRSRLAKEIDAGSYGIDNLDPKYLAEDLMENEPELFTSIA